MTEMINTEHHKSVAGHVATEDVPSVVYGNHDWSQTRSNYMKDFEYEEFQKLLE